MLLPLFVFWPTAVYAIGPIVIAMTGTAPAVPRLPPEVPSWLLVFTPAHLWFLLVLFEIVVFMLAARAVLIRILGADRAPLWSARIGGVLATPFGVLLAALPYAAALWIQAGPPWGSNLRSRSDAGEIGQLAMPSARNGTGG